MTIKTPILDVATKAAKCGVATNRVRLTQDEAKRIREAERQGGHDAGLKTVLAILRERSQRRAQNTL
jgi:hypothetical protein